MCAVWKHSNLLSLISATCSLIGIVTSVTYGPPLVSLTRWDRLTRGPTIFNPDTGRTILLEDYPNYSVVIPLAPDSPSATSNQVFISRRVSGPGEFTVQAPSGYGVMAMIQSLDLRVAEDACNDFILFSEVDGGGVETIGTCGKVDVRDTSPSPKGLIGPRTFISDSGRMKILFYHGFIWGLVRNFNFDIFDSSLNPDLKVEIVFTAYRDCPSLNKTSNIPTESESDLNDVNLFATCSPSVPNSKTCIRKELFCDKTLNCAFGEDFASDEDSLTCTGLRQGAGFSQSRHSQHTTTTTTTTAATTSTAPTTTTVASVKTTELPSSSTSERPRPNSISSTTTEKFVEIKNSAKDSGTDAAGLIGLVRKYPQVEISRPDKASKTFIIRGSSNRPTNLTSSRFNRTEKLKATTTKMPLEKDELFVDVKPDPIIDDSLVNGLSEEEILLLDDVGLSPIAIIAIASATGVVLILIGILRMYYCYNKVIWNPHGSRLKSNNETPPETPNANLMRKMKILAMESEEVFKEKKGKGLKEQPPSYEILFPLPGEKDGDSCNGSITV